MVEPSRLVHPTYMNLAPGKPRHFLRAWRTSSGRYLESVAEAVGALGAEDRFRHPNAEAPKTMTHATLSRIERGLIPYNQTLLEILAEIYGTDVASLLMRDPTAPQAPWSLIDQLRTLRPDQRTQVAAFIEAITGTGTEG